MLDENSNGDNGIDVGAFTFSIIEIQMEITLIYTLLQHADCIGQEIEGTDLIAGCNGTALDKDLLLHFDLQQDVSR